MIRSPRKWREKAALSLADVAAKVGIVGRNPSRTYARYETGENQCPVPVIEGVRLLSKGRVTAESWCAARAEFLKRPSARVA
jgi:transcriptional regulator with XRE-family HTH domain